jgi:hypothetical protein
MAKKGKAKARKRAGKRSVKDLSARSAKGTSVRGAQIGKSINPA